MKALTKAEFVKRIIAGRCQQVKESGEAYAPANIALCKYWGKRDTELNLPYNSSLSVGLKELGTKTIVAVGTAGDQIILNGQQVDPSSAFSTRLIAYLDFFRTKKIRFFKVITENNIPTAAGLASSASGYAALVKALNNLLAFDLSDKELSLLARIGSGSACRSIWEGFVEWFKGEQADGLDSHGQQLNLSWPGLCLGIIPVSTAAKSVGSSKGMQHTVRTSPLYRSWPELAEKDLSVIKEAIAKKAFADFGQAVEANALAMHATMLAARPALIYFSQDSFAVIAKIQNLRDQGLNIYFTADAGPNIKAVFLKSERKAIESQMAFWKVVEY